MLKKLWPICIALLALVACQRPRPTPSPFVPTITPTVGAPVAFPSSTTTPTLAPTVTATETPTAAPATSIPSPTPTSTATRQPSPTMTPTPTATSSAMPTPAARDVVVNAADGLKLRAEANATSPVLRKLGYGTHLTAVGDPTVPDAQGIAWQDVRTAGGQLGWVAAQYVSNAQLVAVTATPATASGTAAVPLGKAGYVYVAAPRGLTVRADASADSTGVVQVAYGGRLETNGLSAGPDVRGDTWLNVKTDDGIVGWVATQWVTDQTPPTATPTPPDQTAAVVAEILRRTNELRQQNGLPPFALDDGLSRLALEHSQYMAEHGITHEGPVGVTAKQRIANAGYGGRPTENIYGGNATVDGAWNYWSTDPPHRANLLHPDNTLVGIGVYQTGRMTYYTMDFAGRPG